MSLSLPRPRPLFLRCGRYELSLHRPLIMGVINLGPDSFSEMQGQRSAAQAVELAHAMLRDGADILDLGGESTRPGAAEVSVDEELQRVIPVLQSLRDCGRPLSVDTRKPEVMRAALAAGADMINDVAGFASDEAVDVVSGGHAGLCIMHMQGDPSTMQHHPHYDDVVTDVEHFLMDRMEALSAVGVNRNRIVFDPGIGFGKTLHHNLQLLEALDELVALGRPVLVGLSRKSMLGALTGRDIGQRLAASVGGAVAAAARGAAIVRVHDVAATCDALKVWQAIDHPEHRWPDAVRPATQQSQPDIPS